MDVEGRRGRSGRRSARTPAGGRTVLFATHYLEEADAVRRPDGRDQQRTDRRRRDGRGDPRPRVRPDRARHGSPTRDPDLLAALPGVDSVEVRGETVVLHTEDSDAVARHLLTGTAARDLEIAALGLEEAFLALTAPATDNGRPDMTALPDERRGNEPTDTRVPPLGRVQPDRAPASSCAGWPATGGP